MENLICSEYHVFLHSLGKNEKLQTDCILSIDFSTL